jgi:hypothetical protein
LVMVENRDENCQTENCSSNKNISATVHRFDDGTDLKALQPQILVVTFGPNERMCGRMVQTHAERIMRRRQHGLFGLERSDPHMCI